MLDQILEFLEIIGMLQFRSFFKIRQQNVQQTIMPGNKHTHCPAFKETHHKNQIAVARKKVDVIFG